MRAAHVVSARRCDRRRRSSHALRNVRPGQRAGRRRTHPSCSIVTYRESAQPSVTFFTCCAAPLDLSAPRSGTSSAPPTVHSVATPCPQRALWPHAGMIHVLAPWTSSLIVCRGSALMQRRLIILGLCNGARAGQPPDQDAARFLYAGSTSATSRAAIGCHIASDQAARDQWNGTEG